MGTREQPVPLVELDLPDERWLRAAFDAGELDALFMPTTAGGAGRDASMIAFDQSGAIEVDVDRVGRARWQREVLAAARIHEPFRRWTVADTVSRWRGVVDQSFPPAGEPGSGLIPAIERRCVRRARSVDDLHSLRAALDNDALLSWLQAPVGRLRRVSRYLHELWLGRADLHGLFPRVGDRDSSTTAFLQWVMESGRREHEIPESLLPSAEQFAPRIVTVEPRQAGIRIAGHGGMTSGVGESARRMYAAIAAAGGVVRWCTEDGAGDLETNLLCMNLDEVEAFARDVGPSYFAGRRTIVMPYWEVDGKPPGVASASAVANEFWAASEFVAGVLRRYVDVPVRVVPLPVSEPTVAAEPQCDRGPFTYGFVFDFNSSVERKAPRALVRAYRQAYPAEDGNTRLVLKTINGDSNADDRRAILDLIMDRGDIELLDGYMPASQRDALMASFDCYVSLHRSEGFGLTIAEALLAGVPVIATGYGASIEFADATTALLVDHEVVAVEARTGPYASVSGCWAEPDVEHASRLMLDVRKDPRAARRRTELGAARLREEYSLEASAKWIRDRFVQFDAVSPHEDRFIDALPPLERVEQLLARGPAADWLESVSGVHRMLRRIRMRVARPAVDRMVTFEAAVVDALREMSAEAAAREYRRER